MLRDFSIVTASVCNIGATHWYCWWYWHCVDQQFCKICILFFRG